MPSLHLKLPPDLAARLKRHQEATDAAAVAVIRRALDEYLIHDGETYPEWVRRREAEGRLRRTFGSGED